VVQGRPATCGTAGGQLKRGGDFAEAEPASARFLLFSVSCTSLRQSVSQHTYIPLLDFAIPLSYALFWALPDFLLSFLFLLLLLPCRERTQRGSEL
jgi:hypothetical protein